MNYPFFLGGGVTEVSHTNEFYLSHKDGLFLFKWVEPNSNIGSFG